MTNCGKCRSCVRDDEFEIVVIGTVAVTCPNCGDKRCPKADYHENKCEGSGQVPTANGEDVSIKEN